MVFEKTKNHSLKEKWKGDIFHMSDWKIFSGHFLVDRDMVKAIGTKDTEDRGGHRGDLFLGPIPYLTPAVSSFTILKAHSPQKQSARQPPPPHIPRRILFFSETSRSINFESIVLQDESGTLRSLLGFLVCCICIFSQLLVSLNNILKTQRWGVTEYIWGLLFF